MIEIFLFPPKIWSWKSHMGYGARSWNPLFVQRQWVQAHVRKSYTGRVLSGPVTAFYQFSFKPASSLPKKQKQLMYEGKIHHTKTPDCTNLQKFFEDALKGVLIEDDKQVIRSTSSKNYGVENRVFIRIIEIS